MDVAVLRTLLPEVLTGTLEELGGLLLDALEEMIEGRAEG